MKRFAIIIFIFSLCSCQDHAVNNNVTNNIDIKKSTPLRPGNCDTMFIETITLTMRPIDFLKSLDRKKIKCANQDWISCNPAPKGWIKKRDIPLLIECLDSNSTVTCAVYSTAPSIHSFTRGNHGYSTLAREAYYIIKSFKEKGEYPPYSTVPTTLGTPAPNTIHTLEDSLKSEILDWWQLQRKKKSFGN